nr:unnamed protein product [Triticum aestivum]
MAVDGSHTHTTSSGCKMERKEVEKNRRLHMKGLCLKLSSLVPSSSSSDHHLRHYSSSPPSSNKDAATQLDQLDSAAAYIKQLRGRIHDLKRRKQAALSLSGGTGGCSSSVSAGDYKAHTTTSLPVIEVRHQDGTLDVALASEAGRPFRLHEVMAMLEQEGAEVVSASFSVVGDKIFYTLHSQALCPRIGRVAQRLRGLAAAAAATVSTLLT